MAVLGRSRPVLVFEEFAAGHVNADIGEILKRMGTNKAHHRNGRAVCVGAVVLISALIATAVQASEPYGCIFVGELK